MSLYDWVVETKQHVAREGIVAGGTRSLRKFHYGAMRRLDGVVAASRIDPGRNVLDAEWDALVVLDGCRYDLMRSVSDEYEFSTSCEPFTSLAGGSLSWMRRTFTDRDCSNVGYVTANPFSSRVLEADDFAVFDEVWRYSWDEELGTVRAPAVTDAAIDALRSRSHDRAVIHYMQPHHPFVPDPIAAGINPENPVDHDRTVWEELRDGTVDRETVWERYRENLRYVMNDLTRLLENIDAPRTVLTADHGNALGEWGIYGHGDYPIPQLRRVPWVRTSATDERTVEPDVDRERVDASVSDQLRDLGYR
ncbi:MAG: hypothetical protein ABEI99_04280 [Halobaculum sp.]